MNMIKYIGIGLLILFYGSYIKNNIKLRKEGIDSNRLGKGIKDKKVRNIELILVLFTYGLFIVQLLSILVLKDYEYSTIIKIIGLIIGFLGIMAFIASTVKMKKNWRAGIDESQETQLVTKGIYEYSRNPAFLGFDLFYIGLVISNFNWIILVISIITMMLLHLQIKEEEKYLGKSFGSSYEQYIKTTRRYLGKYLRKN